MKSSLRTLLSINQVDYYVFIAFHTWFWLFQLAKNPLGNKYTFSPLAWQYTAMRKKSYYSNSLGNVTYLCCQWQSLWFNVCSYHCVCYFRLGSSLCQHSILFPKHYNYLESPCQENNIPTSSEVVSFLRLQVMTLSVINTTLQFFFFFFKLDIKVMWTFQVHQIKTIPFPMSFSTKSDQPTQSCDVIGKPDLVSNLRPYKFHIPPGESAIERRYREEREKVQNWNQEFWLKHNTKFVKVRILLMHW